MSLESITLKVMSLPLEAVTDGTTGTEQHRLGARAVLAQCLQPPDVAAVSAAVKALYLAGAISERTDTADVTQYGKTISSLPCDARVAHMVTIGCMLGYVRRDLGVDCGRTPASAELTWPYHCDCTDCVQVCCPSGGVGRRAHGPHRVCLAASSHGQVHHRVRVYGVHRVQATSHVPLALTCVRAALPLTHTGTTTSSLAPWLARWKPTAAC